MTEISPDVNMRTFTAASPERAEPAKYNGLSGFMPSGSLVKSTQLLPGLMLFHTSHRTYTMPPRRRALQWTVSDSHRSTQPVSYSSWDTDYYTAMAAVYASLARATTVRKLCR